MGSGLAQLFSAFLSLVCAMFRLAFHPEVTFIRE